MKPNLTKFKIGDLVEISRSVRLPRNFDDNKFFAAGLLGYHWESGDSGKTAIVLRVVDLEVVNICVVFLQNDCCSGIVLDTEIDLKQ